MNKLFFVFGLLFLFFSETMSAQQNEQHTTSEIYNINKREFLPHYFSVQETKHNGWKKRLNVVHVTDIHIGSEDADINLQECIDLSKEKNMALSAIIGTGDLTIGLRYPKNEVLSYYHTCRDILMQSDIPTLFQLGNHDANDIDRNPELAITKREQFVNVFEDIKKKHPNIVWGDAENYRHYHYYDITHELGNVRVIMLDQLDHDQPIGRDKKLIYKSMDDAVYSQKQIDWLCNTALQVPEGYGVIIGNHYIYMERGDADSSLLIDDQFTQGWQLIPDIIDAWQNKTTLVKEYADMRQVQSIKVNADFSNIKKGTEFICHLVGHTHYRTHLQLQGYKQLLIMEDSSGQRGNVFSKVSRVKKSPTSNCFSILSIDRTEKCIYKTIYGAYKNYDEAEGSRIEIINYDFE